MFEDVGTLSLPLLLLSALPSAHDEVLYADLLQNTAITVPALLLPFPSGRPLMAVELYVDFFQRFSDVLPLQCAEVGVLLEVATDLAPRKLGQVR